VLLAEDVPPRFKTLEDAVELVLGDSPQRTKLGLQAKVQVIAVAGSLEEQTQNDVLRF
jgi:hypothetical protein